MTTSTEQLLFLDTEFTDFSDRELISIALASLDGREFYGERRNFNRQRCNGFVKTVVLPLLNPDPETQYPDAALREALKHWLAQFDKPRLVIDFEGDWELMAELLGRQMPPELEVINMGPLISDYKIDRYLDSHDLPRHHALYDARANRAIWLEHHHAK